MIARLQDSDLSAYIDLRRLAVRSDPLAFFATPKQMDLWLSSQFHAELNTHLSDPFGSYGFFDHDILVAYISLLPHPSGGLLQNLYVSPASRRRGIARELVESMLDKSMAHGIPCLELSVTSLNAGAIALYAQFGFREVERHVGALRRDGMLLDEVVMRYGKTEEDNTHQF